MAIFSIFGRRASSSIDPLSVSRDKLQRMTELARRCQARPTLGRLDAVCDLSRSVAINVWQSWIFKNDSVLHPLITELQCGFAAVERGAEVALARVAPGDTVKRRFAEERRKSIGWRKEMIDRLIDLKVPDSTRESQVRTLMDRELAGYSAD